MRRKSGRSQNKSFEKNETDSPQRSSDSTNSQSTRRRKRSPSLSKNKEGISYQNVEVKAVEEHKSSDEMSNDVNNTERELNDLNCDQQENNDSETQQECEIKEDEEINQEVTGKSKGKHKTNFNHSRNDNEPENDDVQEFSESNPIDNNECTQNSVGSTQTDLQKSEIIQLKDNNIESENQQHKMELDSFESEYVQDTTVTNTEEAIPSEENPGILEGAEIEERSTTPALPNATLENKSISGKKLDEHEKSDKRGKKRITLKRLPPKNLDEQSQNYPILNEENGPDEAATDKTSKKITLKRQTIHEIPVASHDAQKSSDRERRSSLNETIHDDKRRLSSLSEDQIQHQEMPNKSSKRVKLIRNISLESHGSETSQKTGKQPWGRSEWLNKLSSTMFKIDVDSIKTVCPSVEFLKESDIKLKPAPRERVKSESNEVLKRKLSMEKSEDESEKHNSESESAEELKIDPNPNIIALNRKISIVDDTASKMRPPASPAKNPKSEILYITNLVRPFTVKQLKELLERTGKIRADGFWTDRIKSKCYARYESEDEAEATRNALHGVSWPIGNGKQLVIDFATEEDMHKAKNPVPAVPVVPEILPEKENRFPEPEKLEIRHREHEVEEKRHHNTGRDRSREEPRRRHSRSRSRERVRRHIRRSYTPEVLMKKKPKKEEVPQKLMDDLFLKTKSTPSIYWQPLCPQEIALKQQQRLVRMEEHKRRIEETRTRLRDVRRAPFRRR